jgi:membrane protease YdiL (CAAX protease family)
MIAFAIVAALLAPVVEEIFFRGIIFRPLANGIGVWGAAIASGIFFGMLHWDFQTTERLMQVIPLTMLGVLLAILYAWSGTIFAPIAVHATNNGLAVAVYAGTHDSVPGVIAAVICWLALMVFCFYGPRLTDREPAVTPQVITA